MCVSKSVAKPKQISLKKVLFSRLLMLGWNTAKGVGWRGDKNLQHNWKLEELENLGFRQISFISPKTD